MGLFMFATSASAETVSVRDAEARVGKYFSLGSINAAIAAECVDVAAGPAGTRNGKTLTWHGSDDVNEATSRAIAYESAQNILVNKILPFEKTIVSQVEEVEKSNGGRSGMVAEFREQIRSDTNHMGKIWLCAALKDYVDDGAVPIVNEATIVIPTGVDAASSK